MLRGAPNDARRGAIDAGQRDAQHAAPLEVGAVERAAERVEDEELQALAHLRRNLLVAQARDEFREAARVRIGHSAWMPAARTTLPTRSSSALMCAANSSGVLPITSAPSAARRLATSGCLSAF